MSETLHAGRGEESRGWANEDDSDGSEKEDTGSVKVHVSGRHAKESDLLIYNVEKIAEYAAGRA